MVSTLNFYLDDSGTRRPDHKPGKRAQHGNDWFALGGVIVNGDEEQHARDMHAAFMKKWSITGKPLHSADIRARTGDFLWLEDADEEKRSAFYEGLYCLMRDAPIIGIACVVDRPGYNHRYYERYGRRPWALCKTAFAVAVERATKCAIERGRKLNVYPERCNKPEDRLLRAYFESLKSDGMPFDTTNSGKYGPLTPEQFGQTLYDFDTKRKSSPMAQFADLFLWPMCMGGYHAGNRTYARLVEDKKLIDCYLSEDQLAALGIKYSCFDLVQRKA